MSIIDVLFFSFSIFGQLQLDFWTDPSTIRPVDVMVPRDFTSEFKRMLNKRELYYKVLRQDLQDDVDNDLAEAMRALQKKARIGIQTLDDFDYSIYHPFDEVSCFLVTDFII